MPTPMHTCRVSAVCLALVHKQNDADEARVSDLNRVQADAAVGDSPLWFGEWGLPTQFDATDDFLVNWADAQKLAYSQGAGWIVGCPGICVVKAS